MCTCEIDLHSDLKLVADKLVRDIYFSGSYGESGNLFLVFWETCPDSSPILVSQ